MTDDDYEIALDRARAALGEEFDPQPVSILARKIFPEDPAWTEQGLWERQKALHYEAGQLLGALAFSGEAVKVGERRWARNTTWEDWRDWLCVVMDGVAEGRPGFDELAEDALQHWSLKVWRSGGSISEDFEPVAVQAVSLFANSKEVQKSPWVIGVLRRAVSSVWRPETARQLDQILKQLGKQLEDSELKDKVGTLRVPLLGRIYLEVGGD